MSFLDELRQTADRFVSKVSNARRARQEKAESDITPDAAVAGSRANDDGEDGSYVGRTSPQFDAEVEPSGAEARSEAARLSGENG